MYVGAVPTTGDFKLLDSITTSSATTFNLRQGGVAVYPQSANHCLVVLNGVLQTAGATEKVPKSPPWPPNLRPACAPRRRGSSN